MILLLCTSLSTQICYINVLYLTIGTLLFLTYGSVNCSKSKKLSSGKLSDQPKKAVIEHSVRLSFHNELSKSEVNSENSPKNIAKHDPQTQFMAVDRTQSKAIVRSMSLLSSKKASQLYHRDAKPAFLENIGNVKVNDDLTQTSARSMDYTQPTATSDENDKQSSKTLTESTTKEEEQSKKEKIPLEYGKASREVVTQNISVKKVLDDKNKGTEKSTSDESYTFQNGSEISQSKSMKAR